MGSGEPQRQHLTGKEEKYNDGEQLSSLKASIEPSLHEAENKMGTRLVRAQPLRRTTESFRWEMTSKIIKSNH